MKEDGQRNDVLTRATDSKAGRGVCGPRKTAGPGFAYEDEVVASFLVSLLRRSHPLNGIVLPLTKVSVQKARTWPGFDDLVLTLGEGAQERCAISIKSSPQVSGKSASQDFVRSAWALLLHRESTAFDSDHDWLGLACPPHDALRDLLQLAQYARLQEQLDFTENIAARGYGSLEMRSIAKSLACPPELAEGLQTEARSEHRLLRRLRVLPLDFDLEDSADRTRAVESLQDLLVDGTFERGRECWDRLCCISKKYRSGGGDCTRDNLVGELRHGFELRDLPDFAGDWARIRSESSSAVASTRSVIADGILIDRADEITAVLQILEDNAFVALLGPSGSGKSAIACRVCESSMERRVLWVDAGAVGPDYVAALTSQIALTHPVAEVLRSSRNQPGIVVIDAAEKLVSDSSFAEVGKLLTLLGLGKDGTSTWRALLTCRAEEWERVDHGLAHRLAGWAVWKDHSVEAPDGSALEPVWVRFPNLRRLAARPHLHGVLRNLKVLDAVASAMLKGHRLPDCDWAGEIDLIAWWGRFITSRAGGPAKSALLQRLAVDFADSGRFAVHETELGRGDLPLVADLADVLVRSASGTISFAHDLFADWSRFRFLESRPDGPDKYIADRSTNPYWLGALRLLGVAALDSRRSRDSWKEMLDRIPQMRSILLEALIFSHDPAACLEAAWPTLLDDDGSLAIAFLQRFLYAASMPNPGYVKLAVLAGMTETEARARERLPMWPYWIPVLDFLYRHIEETAALAPQQLAELARSWLHYTPTSWPRRKEAASLALTVGWATHRARPCAHPSDEEGLKMRYRAALEGYPDRPEEVTLFARSAAARTPPTPNDGEALAAYTAPGTELSDPILGSKAIVPPPWPEGPHFPVHEPFASACLFSDALDPIIELDPDFAQELILSCLIEVRSSWREFGAYDPLGEHAGLSHEHRFYPAFYTRGPFLGFLRRNPDAGLNLIVRLLDFATNRRVEALAARGESPPSVVVTLPDGDRVYAGDDHAYHWHRGVWGAEPAASALMATEKWLYDQAASGAPIGAWVTRLLRETRSVAMLGLLAEVGRFQPSLFLGELKPLLLCLDIYAFEDIGERQALQCHGIPFSMQDGEAFEKLAREWSSMAHRTQRFADLAASLFLSDAQLRRELPIAARSWDETAAGRDQRVRDLGEYLTALFDLANWHETEVDGQSAIAFRAPPSLLPSASALRASDRAMSRLALPVRCRSILDGETGITDEEIPTLVETAKDLLVPEECDQVAPPRAQCPADAVCGVAAAVLVKAQHWVREHPADREWCQDVLRQMLRHPPPWPEFDLPISAGTWTWEHFACEAVPFIWAEDPNSREWREAAARLVFAKHYSAAGLLMRRCYELRGRLGEHFWQLVGLMLNWAARRWAARARVWTEDELRRWIQSEVRAFAGPTRPRPPVLRELLGLLRFQRGAPPARWGIRALRKGVRRRAGSRTGSPHGEAEYVEPAIDCLQVHAAFAGTLRLGEATDAEERSRFLDFWEQALLVALSSTTHYARGCGRKLSDAVDAELPADYDNWVLREIAQAVAEMREADKPKLLWESILRLGSRADLWVGRFLDDWFMDARRRCSAVRFVEVWRQMVGFCSTCETWASKGRFSHDLPRLWRQLLGFPRFARGIWTPDDRELLAAQVDLFKCGLKSILPSSAEIGRLLIWASSPAGAPLRTAFLVEVAEYAALADDGWFLDENLGDAVAHFLDCLWREEPASVADGSLLEAHFRALLGRTASLNRPLALELQSRIRAGRK